MTSEIPEGTRFALNASDQEIHEWLNARGLTGEERAAAERFAKAVRDYGWPPLPPLKPPVIVEVVRPEEVLSGHTPHAFAITRSGMCDTTGPEVIVVHCPHCDGEMWGIAGRRQRDVCGICRSKLMGQEYRRVGSGMSCPGCGVEYWRHPILSCGDSVDGRDLTLHVACDGTLVKL